MALAGLSPLASPDGLVIDLAADGPNQPTVDEDGTIAIPTADGGVVIDFNPPQADDDDKDFYANLALKLPDGELSLIAEQLLDGIQADDRSRAQQQATLEKGIDLLGLVLKEPKGEIGTSAAPLEGMSVVQHPLLLEAVLRAQATAAGELLPASGPVKIRNDAEETGITEDEAEALEKDMNGYLTVRATEYYPDTRRALFWSSLGGASFKKVYECPLRRRPVSETVTSKDLIVSNAATDLRNAPRVTHVSQMFPSTMKRMQITGTYRDIPLTQPTPENNPVDDKLADISGVQSRRDRPEDQPYTIYECYCELDIPKYAPTQFRGKGLPLPYRVTLEKDTRVVLEIRRNWDEDDEQCLARKCLVKYPFVEGMGLYGIGLIHILGNADAALTAGWRICLDNGMFGNFPGGIGDKSATRQLTNEWRIPPGGFAPIDVPAGKRLQDMVMGLPYKSIDPAFISFLEAVATAGQRLGGTADTAVGEGRADVPVGTIIAQIEQASKVTSEVHKGLHTAQTEEFGLFRDLFKANPDALWAGCKDSATLKLLMKAMIGKQGMEEYEARKKAAEQKRNELLLRALDACELVPQADPNTPSHVHRIMKIVALKQIAANNPNMDADKIDRMSVRMLGFNADDLFKPPTPQAAPPPDPQLIRAQADMRKAEVAGQKVQMDAAGSAAKYQNDAAKRQTDERVAAMKLQAEQIIHAADAHIAERRASRDEAVETARTERDMVHEREGRMHEAADAERDRAVELVKHHTGLAAEADFQSADQQHKERLAREAAKKPAGKGEKK